MRCSCSKLQCTISSCWFWSSAPTEGVYLFTYLNTNFIFFSSLCSNVPHSLGLLSIEVKVLLTRSESWKDNKNHSTRVNCELITIHVATTLLYEHLRRLNQTCSQAWATKVAEAVPHIQVRGENFSH